MIIIFAGPSLAGCTPELPDVAYLPPASQGDVYRAALKRPIAIGIIDGFFDRVPAVWHKEILWAMAQGIHVFGSASMGALRAAELASFGMVGVGRIFEEYRDGILNDDDEVALVHGTAEVGYREISEPMVNIRFTLADAESEDVLSSRVRTSIEEIAKKLHYPERRYSTILELGAASGLPDAELTSFRNWLPMGRVNQKYNDAVAMLDQMRDRFSQPVPQKTVSFSFEHTALWTELTRSAGELRMDIDTGPQMITFEHVIDELKLNPHQYAEYRRAAMARLLAVEESRRHGLDVDERLLSETIVCFRQELQLLEPEDLQRWLHTNQISQRDFIRLMELETRVRWVESIMDLEIGRVLADELRVANRFSELESRGRQSMRENPGPWPPARS